MPVTLREMLAEESEEARARIYKRAAEIDAEINLRELRRLRKLTQTHLSKKLNIGQEGVSRIEKRTDLYLSTLRSYVEGVGGKLSLVVEFPDRPPVIVTGLGMDGEQRKEKARGKSTKSLPSEPKSRVKSKPKTDRKILQAAR